MRITTGILTGVLLGVVTWMPGCSDEPVVRTYAAAKEVLVPAETAPQPQTSSISLAANLQGGALTWQAPAGWSQQPGSDGITHSVLKPPGDSDLRFTVTIMPQITQPREILDNVNRWRRQVGLGPVGLQELAGLVRIAPPELGIPAFSVMLPGPGEASPTGRAVQMTVYNSGGRSWYFKSFGSIDQVIRYQSAYVDWLASVENEAAASRPGTAEPPSDATANDASPGGNTIRAIEGPGFTAVLPAGWSQEPSNRLVHAAFSAGRGQEAVRITISAMHGDAGGTLLNLVRWRGEVNLPPITSVEQHPGESVKVDGRDAMRYEFVSPDDHGRASVVYMLPHQGSMWFFKMMGPAESVKVHRDAFTEFVGSLRFTDKTDG